MVDRAVKCIANKIDKSAETGDHAALFGKRPSSDDPRFDDVHQAVTLVAAHQQGLDARLGEFSALPEAMAALQARQGATETALDALTAQSWQH